MYEGRTEGEGIRKAISEMGQQWKSMREYQEGIEHAEREFQNWESWRHFFYGYSSEAGSEDKVCETDRQMVMKLTIYKV